MVAVERACAAREPQHDGQGRAHLVVVGLAARGTSARSVIGPKTGQVYSSLII